jgi:pyruvate carboxylase
MKRFGQVTNLPTPFFLEPLAVNESVCFHLDKDEPVSAKLTAVTKAAEDVWNVAFETAGVKVHLLNIICFFNVCDDARM